MTYLDKDSTDIDECITMTLRALTAANEMHYALSYPGFLPCTYGYDKGKKYSRVWVQNWSMPSYCVSCKATVDQQRREGKWDYSLRCDHDKEPVEGQRFVCFFVQRDNGDVWKAGGWKAPALNFTRGNILSWQGRKALSLDKIASNTGYFYPAF
jgi:hypothetical protein